MEALRLIHNTYVAIVTVIVKHVSLDSSDLEAHVVWISCDHLVLDDSSMTTQVLGYYWTNCVWSNNECIRSQA